MIPKGVERVGNHWFWDSEVEGVKFPASVREIGADAFCGCKSLRHVAFATGSRLEKIGGGCFSGTQI